MRKLALLLLLVMFLIPGNSSPVSAIMPGGTGLSYESGLGTSSITFMNDDAVSVAYRSQVDFVHVRPYWMDIEPSKRYINWGILDDYVTKADGKPLLLAIQLKGTYWAKPCAGATRQSGNCYDGSPAWAVADEFHPVMSALQSGLKMINYADGGLNIDSAALPSTGLQAEIAWLYQQLALRKTQNVWPDNVYIMLAPGADSESYPDDGLEQSRYRDTWGAAVDPDPAHSSLWPGYAKDTWVSYVKAMIRVLNTYAHGEERLLVISPHFVDPIERHVIINYALSQAYGNEWGFYTETVTPGYQRNNWLQAHTWDGIYSYGYPTERKDCVYPQYAELADAIRCLGRTHPVYSEISVTDAAESLVYKQEWFSYWTTLACAWQRIDGCGILRQWTEENYLSGPMASWYNALHITWSGDGGTSVLLPLSNRRPDTSNQAWVALHQDAPIGDVNAQYARNFFQWVDQVDSAVPSGIGDTCDGTTTPVWYINNPDDSSKSVGMNTEYANLMGTATKSSRYSAFSRKIPNCAYFTIDPLNEGWWPGGNTLPVNVRVYYLDQGTDQFSLQYWTGAAVATVSSVTKSNSAANNSEDGWKIADFVIPSGAYSFGTKALVGSVSSYTFDFRINALPSGSTGAEYIHMVVVQYGGPLPPTFTPTPQTRTPSATPTRTPTPAPTQTPGGATATPTNTPTATSTPAPRPTGGVGVQSYYVTNAAADAYDRTSSCTTNSAKMGGVPGEDITTGFRFTGITKPSSTSLVQTAFLSFVSQNTNAESISLNIYAQKSATTSLFDCGSTGKPSARATTTAVTAWNPETWIVNIPYGSPDFAAQLNEVLAYAGGSWDGSFVILVKGVSANGLRWPYNYEANTNLATRLDITWYNSGTQTVTPTRTPSATPTGTPPTATPTFVPTSTSIPTDTVYVLQKGTNREQAGDESMARFNVPAGIIDSATLDLYISSFAPTPTWEFSEGNNSAVPGTWSAVTASNPTDCDIVLDTAIKQVGTGSYKADKGSDNTTLCYIAKSALSVGEYTRAQFWFYYDALDASNGIFLLVKGASVNDYYVSLRSDGILQIFDYGNSTTYVGATVLTAATWYKITMSAYHADSGGWLRLLVNGSEEIYQTGIDTLNSTDPGKQIVMGQISSNSIVSDYWFDDVKFSSGAVDFTDPILEVYQMRRAWSGPYSTWSSWNHVADPPSPWYWQTPGAYGPLDTDPDPYDSYRVSDVGWIRVVITEIARQWQTSNYGLLLRLQNPTANDMIRIGGRYSSFKPFILFTVR